jgi:hypothetical protein
VGPSGNLDEAENDPLFCRIDLQPVREDGNFSNIVHPLNPAGDEPV